MDNIEVAIQEMLQLIPGRAMAEKWSGETRWTVAVKEALVLVGHNFGYLTAANGCYSDEGKEWLYDVVWYKSDDAGHLTDVPLVAECEWGKLRSIKEDFEKLLVSRSRYRVIVFQANSENAVRNIFQDFRCFIQKFILTVSGDRFLFVGWAKDRWVFEFHAA